MLAKEQALEREEERIFRLDGEIGCLRLGMGRIYEAEATELRVGKQFAEGRGRLEAEMA